MKQILTSFFFFLFFVELSLALPEAKRKKEKEEFVKKKFVFESLRYKRFWCF